MAMTKLNVFHWHLVDDQSFPYQSDRLPGLSKHGAFSPSAVYSKRDVADVVAYARQRGIRVLPEFDSPGHAASWGKGYPRLLTQCFDEAQQPAGVGPMNPTQEGTYALLWELFREAAVAFPDSFVHVGGDEVDKRCWLSNPQVRQWMAAHGMDRDCDRLQAYHTSRVLRLTAAAGKVAVVWQETADGPGGKALPESVLVQVWKWRKDLGNASRSACPNAGSTAYSQAAAAEEQSLPWRSSRAFLGFLQHRLMQGGQPQGGSLLHPEQAAQEFWKDELGQVTATHRALLSAPWYLNLAAPQEDMWAEYWRVEPLDFRGSAAQKERVVGGEACMWGELVDSTNSLSKTWPLAAAVAERLWSDASVRDEGDAGERLKRHRCRLLARGIAAGPLGPGFCPQELG